jgi:hypothetical protein
VALGYAVRHSRQLHPVSGCAWGVRRGAMAGWAGGRFAWLRSQKASYRHQPAGGGMGSRIPVAALL